MSDFPFLRHEGPDAVLAYRGNRPVRVREFCAEIAALAKALPARAFVVNLCADRYRFAAAFGAALSRGQVSLMLPNKTPALLAQIASQYPDVYALTDTDFTSSDIPVVKYPESLPAAGASPGVPVFPADQLAAYVFTSGSTGAPVPNAKLWGNLAKSARAAGTALGAEALPGAVLVGTVPPQHMYGFESTVLLALQHGLALYAGQPFYPADIHACLEALPAPRMLVTTPVHLRALLADESAKAAAEFLLCATAPLVPQLAAEAEARFGVPLYEIYGCSEAGQVAQRRTTESAEWRCFEGVSLRQDDAGSWASGVFIPAEILLGDVIELRGPGRFLLHGRTSDLVNVAGKRTSLAHLNYHLNSIAGVRDGVFVAPPDDQGAVSRLMAFVVAPGLKPDFIARELRRRIDAAFMPRPLRLVESLPRNSTGKLPQEAIDKLAAEYAER
jgi:acyl-coenzyme A synthetase/AMP-(fatty) acid ligase